MRRIARQLWILGILALGISLPAHAGLTLYYSADPIEAKVIDAETKQPLEGVAVVAHWELIYGTPGGSSPAGQLKVMEAVTDKEGKFHFPGWGPKLAIRSHLSDYRDPELLLFKSGYQYRALTNELTGEDKGARRRSDWEGKTIEMKPIKGTLAEYKGHFEDLNSTLEHITTDDPEKCYWKKIPNMIRAMNRERRNLIAQGVNPHTLSSIDKELLTNDKYFTEKGGCGSPKTFFGDIQ